jgi:phytoene desaturase
MKAVVIGAGIGGIATAIRLACLGLEVTVCEANAYPGGKLSEFESQGYRFDAGPSLFTLPENVDELFELAGKDPKAYFDYLRLEEVCRYFWEDGTRLTAPGQPDSLAIAIEKELGEPAAHIRHFLNDSARKYELTESLFLRRSLHKLSTWFNLDSLRGYLNLGRLEVFRTMHEANARTFCQPKVVQLFNRYATYNGSDPYQTPATLNVIPHLEYNLGAYFPTKGMYGITLSLLGLARELGVSFRFQAPVQEILLQHQQVKGIRLEGEVLQAQVVVSNMDIVGTYRKLLPTVQAPERLLSQPKSTSAIIFYWGIRRQFEALGLHNIFFSEDYRGEFAALSDGQRLHPDPTVYLNISSKHKPDDAPPGCENWFVMVNAPHNKGQDWEQFIAAARQHILSKLSRNLDTEIQPLIETEVLLDPRTIESKTSSHQGALYGNSSNNRYAAFLRHPNFSARIGGLYFVGGSVHPGGGIPLALSSARITADLVRKQLQKTTDD